MTCTSPESDDAAIVYGMLHSPGSLRLLASQRVRIEAAGGSMRVASAPGEGTRVEIRVPGGRSVGAG